MASEFDKNLNISYIGDTYETPSKKLILKHCFCSYIVYFLIYVILTCCPFFHRFCNTDVRHFYKVVYAFYIFAAPAVYFIFKPKSLHKSHSIEICNYLFKIFKQIFNKNTVLNTDYDSILKSFIPTYYEKQALMLIFIKMFFGCLMVNFLHSDYFSIKSFIEECNDIFINTSSGSVINFIKYMFTVNFNFFYSSSLTILFTIDISFFAIGYLTECAFLRNKIRTVDTNILGVAFCLMCYPPFNRLSSEFIEWARTHGDEGLNGLPLPVGYIIKIIALLLILIYTLASVALGTKASNLTNRGIVTRFPYNIVRHPAYITKNTYWIITALPILYVNLHVPNFNLKEYIIQSIFIICTLTFWTFVYYMRAITEERHLMQDPDYQEYVKKVPWRFIPHIM